jgi:hypothetical protein
MQESATNDRSGVKHGGSNGGDTGRERGHPKNSSFDDTMDALDQCLCNVVDGCQRLAYL